MKSDATRRSFLQTAGATAGTLAALSQFPGGFFAGEHDILKVGLVGCGGRGTGAAFDALDADPYFKFHAIGDAFQDHIDEKLPLLKKKYGDRIDVGDRQFVGFDAYKKVIDCCDVVLLATPPHFRPLHLAECVAKGKHVFFEKPVAVDAPGIRSVLASAKAAKEKNITFASGFCYRYDFAKRETIKRIHDGAIGDVIAMQINYNMGELWHRGHDPKWSDMEYQLRNWYYFTWLSGDHIVEQHVHNHDKAAWVFKGETPIAASGMGGRQVRTDPKFGNIFDHHSVVYEYANGARLFSFCRQSNKCQNDVSDHVLGTKGIAELMEHTISGATKWAYEGTPPNMYKQEHIEIWNAMRQGKPINDGESAANSSMMAILGRMCTYSGQRITWAEAMESKVNLSPKAYEWGPAPEVIIATPGRTKVL